MRIRIVAMCVAVLLPRLGLAQVNDEAQASESNSTLNEVLVTGEFPGPGLWKVSMHTDDGEHVLWILGDVGPIPKEINWRTREVERVIADSQEIIGNSSVGITFENTVGIFKTLLVAPSLLKARHNPNGQSLQDVVPNDVYDRWLMQKAKYIGRDSGVEKWRPTFAADKLKDKALQTMHEMFANGPWAVIRRVAKENKMKITSPGIWIKIPNEEIKPTIKQFLKTSLPDVDCFTVTIAMVEALSDTDAMRARGAAWAAGDLRELRRLPALPDTQPYCGTALTSSQVVKDLNVEGADNLPEKLMQIWFEAIDQALVSNRSTFAVLPISELMDPNGRLSGLREKGYTVEEPQQFD